MGGWRRGYSGRVLVADRTGGITASAVGRANGSWLRTMPATGGRYFGQANGNVDDGTGRCPVRRRSLRPRDSRIAGFVDGHHVTAYRTAATSAAALDRLAPAGPVPGVRQWPGSVDARWRLPAIREIEELGRLPDTARRAAFAASTAAVRRTSRATPSRVRQSCWPRRAASCRSSTGLAAPHTVVVSIGSTVRGMEIDVSVVGWCDRSSATTSTGEMRRQVTCSRPREPACRSPTRRPSTPRQRTRWRLASVERPMFKSVGSGLGRRGGWPDP